MYLCMYTNMIWLLMIKARIRWCTCRVENILTLGKLLSLWFCFLLHSILFLISQTSYRTYKIISSYELARPLMGTIFLVYYNSAILNWTDLRVSRSLRSLANNRTAIKGGTIQKPMSVTPTTVQLQWSLDYKTTPWDGRKWSYIAGGLLIKG